VTLRRIHKSLIAIAAIVLCATCFAATSFAAPCLAARADEAKRAGDILNASGVEGGLVVHLGCTDGKLTAALRANDRYVVQGLATAADDVATARKQIQTAGLYGPVSVRQWDGRRLPYADNLVNLLVVACDVPDAANGADWANEILRVLAPGGVAVVDKATAGKRLSKISLKKTDVAGRFVKFTKPWPTEIDERSHYLHGPSNNAVAQDERVGPPTSMQ